MTFDPTRYDNKVDTLAKFGATFQSKAIASIIRSPNLLTQSFDIINPNYFETEGNRWIVEKTLSYFMKYKRIPTWDYFKTEMLEESSDAMKAEVRDKLKNVFGHKEDPDLEYVKDSLLEFARHQTLKSAILRSVDYLQEERFDDIKMAVDTAMRAGEPKDFGHDWKMDFEHRLNTPARNVVATGWGPIDQITNGGLAAGELGVIVAPSGAGKSWGLTKLGANAMLANKKIIHCTLELNEFYVGTRYDTTFSGIEPCDIPNHKDLIREIVTQIPGENKIKFYPAKSATCNTLSAYLQQIMSLGYTPDLMLVDYADLLRSMERAEARYIELGAIYEQLRGLAGEYQIPIWTASQSQRSSIQDDVIQADKIAESYSKIMTADFVVSLSRKLEDKVNHTGRMHVIKNRFGSDGMTFPVYMNPALGKMEVYDENSDAGTALRKTMQTNEADHRRELGRRFAEMSDDSLSE